jgi:CRP/FNR family transcriptional regulator, cyclic AMP receptor protein
VAGTTSLNKEDLLARVPMFSALNRKELKQVAKLVDEISRPGGTVLADEGESGREFFLIIEGTADVLKGRKRVASLGPGQFFGEISLIDHGPRTATVKAATDVTLLLVGSREFSGLLDKVPNISKRLLIHLCTRLRECESPPPPY